MPKVVDKEAKRREIAEAAAHLFFLEGFENTPVRAITAAAGISKGSFYDYFVSKTEILRFIAGMRHRMWRELFEGAMASAEGQRAGAVLSALVRAAVSSVASGTPDTVNMLDLWRIGMRGRGDAALADAMDRSMAELRGMIAGIIEQGKAEGAFRGDADPQATAVVVLGTVSGLTMQLNLMKNTPLDPEGMAEKTCRLILSGLEANPPQRGVE